MSTNILSKIGAFIWGEPTVQTLTPEIRQQKNGRFILIDETNTKVGEYARLRDARRGATRRGFTNVLERTDTFSGVHA